MDAVEKINILTVSENELRPLGLPTRRQSPYSLHYSASNINFPDQIVIIVKGKSKAIPLTGLGGL
jgi:hypothetical protein